MGIHKFQVFLASRFDEFQELRAALKCQINRLKLPPVEVIDLNDNAADSEPPLSRCYEAVDRAELFILLVGDEYGTIPDGKKESFVHLEHRRARLDGAKTILPFLIGDSHHQNFRQSSYSDSKLGAWVSEIRKNHTPSYLEKSLDPEQLANNIYDEVLTRLVELFSDVDEGDIEDGSDEPQRIPEDSPIRLEQLANSPKMSTDRPNSGQLLKILAANHATEALAALNLNLPQVAIHHLRKADELVPLDIVIGYWLARLLVATGRRKQCLEARRIALLCVRVAESQEIELEAMACRVLAVRASERLGEFELAMEYAKAAHYDMGHHWMAKFEYGRQLALDGDKKAALEMARQAFWLRPDLIRQIQRDAAFRKFGKDFEQFRATLRQTVLQEAEGITRVESRSREFEKELDGGIEYPVELITNGPYRESLTILQMVRANRVSVKSTLQTLQHCAKKLLADSVSFAFNGLNGLTPEVKEYIEKEISNVNLERDTLTKQQRIAKQRVERITDEIATFMGGGIWGGGVLLTVAAAIFIFSDAIAVAVIIVIIVVIGASVVWQKVQSLETDKATRLSSVEFGGHKLKQASDRLAELTDALSLFEVARSKLQRNTKIFCELVDEFELAGLKRLPFAPAAPVDRNRSEELVRSDEKKLEKLGIAFDVELLPEQLRFVVESSTPKSTHWLARRVRSDEVETVNRSAAYFQ